MSYGLLLPTSSTMANNAKYVGELTFTYKVFLLTKKPRIVLSLDTTQFWTTSDSPSPYLVIRFQYRHCQFLIPSHLIL